MSVAKISNRAAQDQPTLTTQSRSYTHTGDTGGMTKSFSFSFEHKVVGVVSWSGDNMKSFSISGNTVSCRISAYNGKSYYITAVGY